MYVHEYGAEMGMTVTADIHVQYMYISRISAIQGLKYLFAYFFFTLPPFTSVLQSLIGFDYTCYCHFTAHWYRPLTSSCMDTIVSHGPGESSLLVARDSKS